MSATTGLTAAVVLLSSLLAAPAVAAAGQPLTQAVPRAPPVAEGPAGSLPTRPVLVDTIADTSAIEGALIVYPAVTIATLGEGRAVQPELAVANGGDDAVDLSLEAVAVNLGADGAPVITDEEPDAAVTFELPAATVHLEPGEQATLLPTVTDAAGARAGSIAVALVADAGGTELVGLIAVDLPDPGGAVDVEVTATRTPSPHATVAFDARTAASTIVGGAILVRSFGGVDLAPLPPTLVVGGTRRLRTVDIGASLPGPYTVVVDVDVGANEPPQRAETTIWLWPRPAVTIGAGVILALLIATLLVTLRRRRRHLPSLPTGTDEEPIG